MDMQPLPLLHTVALRPAASTNTDDTLDPSPVEGSGKASTTPTIPSLRWHRFRIWKRQRFGAHHAIALWAAQITACNTLGFLSMEQNAAGGLGFPLDAIMLAGSYYFYCVNRSSKYRVCRSFLS